jgi:hypothetical protein
MWLYTFKSQFVSVTKKSGHQEHDYKGGLLYLDPGWYLAPCPVPDTHVDTGLLNDKQLIINTILVSKKWN